MLSSSRLGAQIVRREQREGGILSSTQAGEAAKNLRGLIAAAAVVGRDPARAGDGSQDMAARIESQPEALDGVLDVSQPGRSRHGLVQLGDEGQPPERDGRRPKGLRLPDAGPRGFGLVHAERLGRAALRAEQTDDVRRCDPKAHDLGPADEAGLVLEAVDEVARQRLPLVAVGDGGSTLQRTSSNAIAVAQSVRRRCRVP